MQHQQLTPEQKARIKKREERRRRERQRRVDEYRSNIERLRRQIAEARRRRQRMLLLFLLAVLILKEQLFAAFTRSILYRPNPDRTPDATDWKPSPEHDYAPRRGSDDYCDGYSYEQWTRMQDERGIRLSRKVGPQEAWKADPDYEHFPRRYRDWHHKPFVGQLMAELAAPYWQSDAHAALKLVTPHEVHTYLDEAYVTDPGDLRQCLAERDADIIRAIQTRALLWEERKRKEAEEAEREQKLSRKNDDDQGTPEPD